MIDKRKSSNKKKVLVIASTYPRWQNDPEPRFVHSLCQQLSDEFAVHVLCPHSPGSKKREVMDGVVIHRFRYAPEPFETLVSNGGIMSNLKNSPWKWLLVPIFLACMIFSIIRLTSQIRPSLIHAHWIIPQGLALWVASKLIKLPPVILTSHGSDLFSLQSPWLRKLKSRALLLADHTTVVSHGMLNEAQQLGATSSNLSVAPMGVDLAKFSNTGSNTAFRKDGRILFVGRLVKGKGLSHLLSALPLVQKEYPMAHLLIAGDGPEMTSLQAQTDTLKLNDQVTFLGQVTHEELPTLYREASLFVAPFIAAEGLGLVTLEAIFCGCPTLVGDVPAVRDIFPEEQQEYIVNPLDTAAFAKRIIYILQEEPDIKPLEKYAIDQYNWPACAERYARIYREAINRKLD